MMGGMIVVAVDCSVREAGRGNRCVLVRLPKRKERSGSGGHQMVSDDGAMLS